MKKFLVLFIPALLLGTVQARADEQNKTQLASVNYVSNIVEALRVPDLSAALNAHIDNKANPHEVTAAQVGLGGLVNEDTGIVNIDKLPVGATGQTVASGADDRFDTVATTGFTGTAPDGRAYIWFN